MTTASQLRRKVILRGHMGALLSSPLGVPAMIPEILSPPELRMWLRLTRLAFWSEMGTGKEPKAQTKGKALCYQGKSHTPQTEDPAHGGAFWGADRSPRVAGPGGLLPFHSSSTSGLT